MNWIYSRRIVGISVLVVLLAVLLARSGCGRSAGGTHTGPMQSALVGDAQGDINSARIVLAGHEIFQKLERPPVVFDHGRHAEALKEEGCKSCHDSDKEGNRIYKFGPGTDELDLELLQKGYHDKCLQCHGGDAEQAEGARALACGECHVDSTEYQSVAWQPAVFDHYHHLDEMQQGCGTCHHVYDEKQHKLVYEKGKEIACGRCHKDKDEQNRRALRKAGHTGCIGCHEEEYEVAKSKLDPYTCKECHKPEEPPGQTEKTMFAMRTFRSNPTNILISYPGSILPPVPFDHEKHDPKKECSKCCHHFHVRTLVSMDSHFKETGDACRQCHLEAEVSERAGCIRPDRIYHDPELSSTCIGCHTEENKKENQEKTPVKCKGCHTGEQPAPVQPVGLELGSPTEGPDIYIISRLSQHYLPVRFPHSKHSEMLGSCDSCHHHGPEKEYPPCNTCHGEPLNFTKMARPRLISAYHRMCMGCHRNMGIGPTTCTKCHEEKETIYSPGQHLIISSAADIPDIAIPGAVGTD